MSKWVPSTMHHGDAMPLMTAVLMLQAHMDPEKQLVVDGKIQAVYQRP